MILFLASCSNLPRTWNLRQYATHNIYSAVDMSLFHGFENKVTVAELRAKHGEPIKVLDGKKFADADGYDIWEYAFQQDTIDCYVKRGTGIVDYIYSEFAKPRKIHDIVKDRQLADSIVSANTFADYLVDDFKGTVRILKKRNSAKYAVNIAIDDNELLVGSESLREELEGINDNCPIPLAYFCNITSCSYDNKVMTINCEANETQNANVIEKIKSDSDFGNQFVTCFWGDKGMFSFLTPKILDEKADIKLVFKGNQSGSTAELYIDACRLLGSPTTALQRLKAMVAYDNMGTANISDDADKPSVIMNPREIRDGVLYVSITYVAEPVDISEADFKRFVTKLFLSNENPDQEIVLLCAQSGIGLSFASTYSIMGRQKTYTANFTNSELKALREKIR